MASGFLCGMENMFQKWLSWWVTAILWTHLKPVESTFLLLFWFCQTRAWTSTRWASSLPLSNITSQESAFLNGWCRWRVSCTPDRDLCKLCNYNWKKHNIWNQRLKIKRKVGKGGLNIWAFIHSFILGKASECLKTRKIEQDKNTQKPSWRSNLARCENWSEGFRAWELGCTTLSRLPAGKEVESTKTSLAPLPWKWPHFW